MQPFCVIYTLLCPSLMAGKLDNFVIDVQPLFFPPPIFFLLLLILGSYELVSIGSLYGSIWRLTEYNRSKLLHTCIWVRLHPIVGTVCASTENGVLKPSNIVSNSEPLCSTPIHPLRLYLGYKTWWLPEGSEQSMFLCLTFPSNSCLICYFSRAIWSRQFIAVFLQFVN